MWVLNLDSLRVYLRCYVVKGVWEFLVMYYFKISEVVGVCDWGISK